MNISQDQIDGFVKRIDSLDPNLEPKFGQMNVHQMVCHCTDFFRMAMGTMKAEEYGVLDPQEVVAMVRAGKSAPTPKGFGQVEGQGTAPTDFEDDKKQLKEHLQSFANLADDYQFAEHPIFGIMSTKEWIDLSNYHLNHHLKQFGV